MNVHREDQKLERILVAVRKGFYAHYFSVVLVLRLFFDASGCLMKYNEEKKPDSEYVHFENLSEDFVLGIFPTRAVLACINVFVMLKF